MNTLEIIIIIVAIGAIVVGFKRGIICQLGSVVGLVAAIVACRLFGDAVASVFTPEAMENTAFGAYVGKIVGGAIIYIVVYVGVSIVARGLRCITHALQLGLIDRVAGAAMSLLKWGVALSLALNLWLALFPSSATVKSATIGGGGLVKGVMELAPALWGVATQTVFDNSNNQGDDGVLVEKPDNE